MARSSKPPTNQRPLQLATIVDKMQNNSNIVSFDMKVDKRSGVVRYNAKDASGRVITKTILGPGLEAAVRFDPTQVSTAERDAYVKLFLAKGLTQSEVATQMGISQSLVSRIHRS